MQDNVQNASHLMPDMCRADCDLNLLNKSQPKSQAFLRKVVWIVGASQVYVFHFCQAWGEEWCNTSLTCTCTCTCRGLASSWHTSSQSRVPS